jgi:amino acid transporter
MPGPTTQPTLRRALSVRDLVVFGLLFIGPLATVGFFGVLDARADGAVALVYVLATLAMGCTAWSYAQMSRVVPHAGSVFACAREAIGPRAGFIAGWMAMLDYLLIPAVAYLISGIAVHAIPPATRSSSPSSSVSRQIRSRRSPSPPPRSSYCNSHRSNVTRVATP